MKLGVGKRLVGEPCWSHAQCTRSDENSFCAALKCHCETGFHNIDGRCSRNYWEDLGLKNWELLTIAFVSTLFLFAVFIGCVYYTILSGMRFARRHRKTIPTGDPPPTQSFNEPSKDDKVGSKEKNRPTTVGNTFIEKTSVRNTCIKNTTISNTTIKNTTVKNTSIKKPSIVRNPLSKPVMMEFRKPVPDVRQKRDEEAIKEGREKELEKQHSSSVDTIVVKPATFILPLDYSHYLRRSPFDRSISFGSDVPTKRPGGVVRTGGIETSTGTYSHQSNRFSWSSIPSETGSNEPESDWYQPNRRQFRRSLCREDLGKTYQPLLLRASTFSESDESP